MNAAQRNSNADNFIQSLDVQAFTFKEFARIFESPVRAKAEQFLSERQSDWLKRFYALCADAYDDLDSWTSNTFAQNMKLSQVIRSNKGKMHRSSDIYILPVNVTLITKTTPIVDSMFVLSSSKTDKTCEKIRTFFHEELSIQEYGPRIEVEKILQTYNSGIVINDQYFKDLIVFATYRAKHNDIDFSDRPIFLFRKAHDNKLYIAKAPDLFLGKTYGNESGETLACAYEKDCLWKRPLGANHANGDN